MQCVTPTPPDLTESHPETSECDQDTIQTRAEKHRPGREDAACISSERGPLQQAHRVKGERREGPSTDTCGPCLQSRVSAVSSPLPPRAKIVRLPWGSLQDVEQF